MASTYSAIYQAQVQFFNTGITRSYAFRKTQLKKLNRLIRQNETQINEALFKDLQKHPQEVYMTELGPIYEEIKVQLKGLYQWMQPQPVSSSFFLFPASSVIYPQPLGNVFIISPWNYPALLTIKSIIGAIAAGNTVLVKPSEISAHTAALLEQLINENFEPGFIKVINGDGATVIPQWLNHFHFDHVMFTGSTVVGKKIMEMAAQHLSPVTLELGGKSPCIVDADASIAVTAKRIVWGKFLACGQTCVAPDYLIVHESIKDKLVAAIIKEIEKNYGADARASNSYPRIINAKRFETLKAYLQEGRILYGGNTDEADRFIAPTLMDNVQEDGRLMREEIFGPILPIFTFKEKTEVLALIQKNPYPLALYIFSSSNQTARYYIDHVRFGGGAVNETILQLGNSALPFGGVGYSGFGAYHGKHSFDTFTHYKGIVKRATWFEPAFRHAPFSAFKANIWRKLLGR
jgi:aldehyde dehydrogenase (NAD+)